MTCHMSSCFHYVFMTPCIYRLQPSHRALVEQNKTIAGEKSMFSTVRMQRISQIPAVVAPLMYAQTACSGGSTHHWVWDFFQHSSCFSYMFITPCSSFSQVPIGIALIEQNSNVPILSFTKLKQLQTGCCSYIIVLINKTYL